MILAERLALLLLDADGRLQAYGPLPLRSVLAASLLADLVLAGRLHFAGDAWRAEPDLPLAHPLLAGLQHALGRGPHTARDVLRVACRQPALAQRLLDGLARRDIVHRIARLRPLPVLGWRYPPRSQQSLARVRADLEQAAAQSDSTEGLALLLLADAAALLARLDAARHGRAYAALAALDAPMPADTGSGDGGTLIALAALRRTLLDS